PLASRQLAFRSRISSHRYSLVLSAENCPAPPAIFRKSIRTKPVLYFCPLLNSASLGRSAPVVRHRGDVRDAADLEAKRVERAHRGLASRARTLDAHLEVLDPV